MLAKTAWHITNRVILQAYSGNVTLEDMQTGHEQVIALLSDTATSKDKVHLLLDFSARETFATELMALPKMRELFDFGKSQSKIGWFIVVQRMPNPVMRFISLAAANATGFKLHIVPTMDDAHTFLKRVDISLLDANGF